MDERRRDLILHKRVQRIADEHGCSVAEVNTVLDHHPIETNRAPTGTAVRDRDPPICDFFQKAKDGVTGLAARVRAAKGSRPSN
jgi:hypothetical protein